MEKRKYDMDKAINDGKKLLLYDNHGKDSVVFEIIGDIDGYESKDHQDSIILLNGLLEYAFSVDPKLESQAFQKLMILIRNIALDAIGGLTAESKHNGFDDCDSFFIQNFDDDDGINVCDLVNGLDESSITLADYRYVHVVSIFVNRLH
jgi:hypothetical protein